MAKRVIAFALVLMTLALSGCGRGKTTIVYLDKDDDSDIKAPPAAPVEEEPVEITELLPPPELAAAPAAKAPTDQETESEPDTTAPADNDAQPEPESEPTEYDYVLNTNSKKFHYPDCSSVGKMKDKNKGYHTGTRDELIDMGYTPCGSCKP